MLLCHQFLKLDLKHLLTDLLDRVRRFNWLPLALSGFRKGYSCETALLNDTDNVLKFLFINSVFI